MPLKALAFNATLKASYAEDLSLTERMIGLIDNATSARRRRLTA